MGKITKANIAAARAQRDILVRRGKKVPERVQQIADLDFSPVERGASQESPQPQARPAPEGRAVKPWSNIASLLSSRLVKASDSFDPPASSVAFFDFHDWNQGSGNSSGILTYLPQIYPSGKARITIDGSDISMVIVHKDELGSADRFIHWSAETESAGHEVRQADLPPASKGA